MSKNRNVPELRFKEFSSEYREYKLSELMQRYSENNKDEEFLVEDILSLSSKFGIVNRRDILEDTYSKVNHKNYIKTSVNDIVYGKSISASYPYGLFKVNNCKNGLLSTLYFTFKAHEKLSPAYLDRYFSHHIRANNFLKKYVLVGDRYITADANYILSGKIFIPFKQEQQKIDSFLTCVDDKLQIINKKKSLLEQYKRGVMQKIFSQRLKFKDDKGNDFPEWEEKKLGEIGETYNGLTGKTKENFGTGKPYIQYKQIFDDSKIDISRFEFVDVKDSEKQNKVLFGDVFFTVSSETPNEIGTASVLLENVGELYLNSFCFGYRANSLSILSPYFSRYLFRSELFRTQIVKLAQGSTRFNMSKVQLMKIEIQLPSLQEQTKIASFITSIDEKINQCQFQIEKTEGWKKGLLQKMFI